MQAGAPIERDLVLVGGGHAHVFVLRAFAMRPMPGTRITLVSREMSTPYSGMIPGFVAGLYDFEQCHIDLPRLAQALGVRLIQAEAIGIDRAAKRVLLADRPALAYDVLSLDIGSAPRAAEVPGAAGNAIPVKPISAFAARWQAIEQRAREQVGPLRLAVVGAGAGGVELAMAARARLGSLGKSGAVITLVSREMVLPEHSAAARRRILPMLAERAIVAMAGNAVSAVEPGRLLLADGASLEADEILWVTQAGAAPWLAQTGLELDEAGFIKVDAGLRSLNDPAIFAAGDCANVVPHPRPKAGVFAVRQGMPLARNLRRALGGQEPLPFTPQRRYLALIGSGDGEALAVRGRWAARGRWAWRLKDWIDRRWMEPYQNPAPMVVRAEAKPSPERGPPANLMDAAMRCGGCGAKVGASVLARALARLGPGIRGQGVLIGLDGADDAAVIAPPPGLAMAQSIDFFRALVDDPYLFGQIAAQHALGDLYAMGAQPHSALALAVVPYAAPAKQEEELYQLLAGARAVLDRAGVALIGGHSGEGSELALGFSVNGLVAPEKILRKGGLQQSQSLVLTKALGTGALFAAAMRGRAKGKWIERALVAMRQGQGEAAEILRRHGASACTDVTGFGLAGHLAEMLRASQGIGAAISLARLPALDGALSVLGEGIASSLQPENERALNLIEADEAARAHEAFRLLFDPQTAGGLLAGIDGDRAQACVDELRAAGYGASAIIGAVTAARPGDAPLRVNVD